MFEYSQILGGMYMKEIPFSPPDIQEEDIEAVVETLKSGWITTGPRTKEFEDEIAKYCQTNKAVCVNSATAGLELILRALGIGAGDEVITSAYTYTASASVIYHVGAQPVLVDTAPGSYHIDSEKIGQAITPRTKAIIAVDVGGVMCDYAKLFEIVDSYKKDFLPSSYLQKVLGRVAIVADAAHSFGASYREKRSGNAADFSSFSFHAVKNLITGEGGAITWQTKESIDDEELYKQLRLLALQGQNKDALTKTKLNTWEYDVLMLGHKCNMPDIMAALGLSQFKRYQTILDQREKITQLYNQLLVDAPVKVLQHKGKDFKSSFHLYLVSIEGKNEESRNKVIEEMYKKGIITNVHYKPLPMHTVYKNLGFDINSYPQAYEMYKKEITLPLYTLLKEEDIRYIADTLKSLL